ncbi:hypothetical protein [Ignavibacterium sp.]|uniref:hypothetical protein n=1 Tax=Ignavibacterium sp. TaxID=2651167 RepID=UPI002201D79A|nr:hypothetical protein [Ignavibacterium sp.]BDQ02524.1 MAG: hypothetical protein KatS3mg037_1099 [Ignavibacterium sp.]
MREQFSDNKNLFEGDALSSPEELSLIDKRNSEYHNQQLHEIVLKKQKLIIYLSIVYTAAVIGSLIYLIFLK